MYYSELNSNDVLNLVSKIVYLITKCDHSQKRLASIVPVEGVLKRKRD